MTTPIVVTTGYFTYDRYDEWATAPQLGVALTRRDILSRNTIQASVGKIEPIAFDNPPSIRQDMQLVITDACKGNDQALSQLFGPSTEVTRQVEHQAAWDVIQSYRDDIIAHATAVVLQRLDIFMTNEDHDLEYAVRTSESLKVCDHLTGTLTDNVEWLLKNTDLYKVDQLNMVYFAGYYHSGTDTMADVLEWTRQHTSAKAAAQGKVRCVDHLNTILRDCVHIWALATGNTSSYAELRSFVADNKAADVTDYSKSIYPILLNWRSGLRRVKANPASIAEINLAILEAIEPV